MHNPPDDLVAEAGAKAVKPPPQGRWRGVFRAAVKILLGVACKSVTKSETDSRASKFVSPLQGLDDQSCFTQGGASRRYRFALPWAGM